ncbi:MAG: diguanylate cyclase [Firmicutes bacterium]|nr:diguanylate cyclase [Bacillota bacterium]
MVKEELIELQKQVSTLRAEGKYEETIKQSHLLLEYGQEIEDYKSILTAYLHLAVSYYCISDMEEAFNYISIYVDICNGHGDEIDQLQAHNVLFLLYEYHKDNIRAKETLRKSIKLSKKLKKYNILSNALSNYSHICYTEKRYKKALELAMIGLDMAKLHQPDSPILKLRVKLNLAKAYIMLQEYNKSKELIDEMLSDQILETFPREKTQCYDLLSHWYSEQNLYREAYQSLNQAKDIIEPYDDVYLLKEIHEERCRLCELMEDVVLGYHTQKEYIDLLKKIKTKELDITAKKVEIKLNVSSIVKKANTDSLTGIYNRRYLEATANLWLKQAEESNSQVVCILIDIDNLKQINDVHGHLFGDEAIKLICKACSNVVEENGIVGRFGGDEFVIILNDITIETAKIKAEQILEQIRSIIIRKEEQRITLSVSMGIADNVSSKANQFSELFHYADLKMYQVKQNGKNNISM